MNESETKSDAGFQALLKMLGGKKIKNGTLRVSPAVIMQQERFSDILSFACGKLFKQKAAIQQLKHLWEQGLMYVTWAQLILVDDYERYSYSNPSGCIMQLYFTGEVDDVERQQVLSLKVDLSPEQILFITDRGERKLIRK